MNKKFSTLVASILLASSVGAYAATTLNPMDKIVVTAKVLNAITPSEVDNYSESKTWGGYKEGQSYFLGLNGKFLTVDADNNLYLVPIADLKSVEVADKALWTLKKINAPVGALAPTYQFVNKFSKVVFSLDTKKAVALGEGTEAIQLGGEQSEWLSASSYKVPVINGGNPIYAAASEDEVFVLATKTVDTKDIVYLAKTTKDKLTTAGTLLVNPYQVAPTNGLLTLSPQQLNTMLGAAGTVATKDSYFSLGFPAGTTVNGQDNIWEQDLQAMAISQFELAYGKTESDKEVSTELYSSFYPQSSKAAGTDAFKDVINAENTTGFNAGAAQWVALKNRDGQYLVVDTAFVNGTAQSGNERITFKFDNLYNAKNETRFRDPRSYLFRVDYNAVTGNVEIHSYAYLQNAVDKSTTAFNEVTFNKDGYKAQPVKEGSKWYSGDNGAKNAYVFAPSTLRADDESFITKAALGSVTEVTVGKLGANNANMFAIKLGNSGKYNPTTIGSGAYLIQVVASENKDNVGKYWVNNLGGGFEIREEAARQNFQDMPSAQWIVRTIGSTVSSIANREFTGAPNDFTAGATSYGTGVSGQAFFAGKDTLAFIPVKAIADKYLGYKYVADDSIKESNFTFNYLHELAMDKPINTKNDKDSVVWVDNNGTAMKFILVPTLDADDNYGTNGGLTGVANLVRRAYKIKVNDATKLENDKRYLSYDENKKKYIVSKDEKKSTNFFLKENNEVEGGECYYTLVSPQYVDNLVSVAKKDGAYDFTNYSLVKSTVSDNDLRGLFISEEKEVNNPETGVPAKQYVPKVYTSDEADAYLMIKNNSNYLDKIQDGTTVNYYIQYKNDINFAASYASSKVSVDNNTLDLVNGVINDGSTNEVANSAFAVKRDADPLYRRFNTVNEGVASDAPDTVKFYRVNATNKEYLYEDANSVYSKDKNFNFLGVEDKGVTANSAIFVDTAYIHGAKTVMPQYLLALRPAFVKGDTVRCQDPNHKTDKEVLECYHTKITPSYTDAAYLINLQDSVDLNIGLAKAKYQWNNTYTRLGFVDARHKGDTLIIKNSIYTGNAKPIKIGEAKTIASKDTICLNDNKHKTVAFSFRLIKTGSNDFLIESRGNKAVPTDNSGAWVKIQNGVPVVAQYASYKEAALDAEVFNVEKTSDAPTANDAIDTENVSIAAGNGNVTIKNAAGKTVAISNILGQAIAQTVLTSDNATISVPAGIVVVSVEGEDAVKAIVR